MSKRITALLLLIIVFLSGCGKRGGEAPSLLSDEAVLISEKHFALAEPTVWITEYEPAPTELLTPEPTEIPEEIVEALIPAPASTELPTPEPNGRNVYYTVSPGQFTDEEIYLVARFITCEARYAGDEGQRSVASVVLNRVLNSSGRFPSTVTGVLLQRNQFVKKDKLYSTEPTSKALKNARYVFSEHGSTLPKMVLFYKAAFLGTTWEDYMDYYKTIEGNCFFYGKYYF
ncbi:MAG: cell wall hydrolase [Clostridia bacterium]|nr:cell wall hydrolase [Clostridia bacterium]